MAKNKDPYYQSTAFYGHAINGALLWIGLVLFIYLLFTKNIKLVSFNSCIAILVLSVGFGLHAISHLGLEVFYNYNPMYTIQQFIKKYK